MKLLAKMLGVTCVAALALAAMTTAGASAATFTASATGTLTGTATSNQVFTTSAGSFSTVTCKKAHTTGTIVSTAAATQHVTVAYSECTANFGFSVSATISPATYLLYANGDVDIVSTITISVPALGCKTTVGSQKGLTLATYANKEPKIEQTSAITGIVSKGEGLCPGGNTGTYTGTNLIERVTGGSLTWDA
jgi:hypothetical protein